jgi:hypothetical protein
MLTHPMDGVQSGAVAHNRHRVHTSEQALPWTLRDRSAFSLASRAHAMSQLCCEGTC